MDFLTKDEITALRIEQLIFHVVQHEDTDPILLDETPIGEFESFFLDRVKETLKGNGYEFVKNSSTFQLLKDISSNPKSFIPNSKQLAVNFHSARNKRIKPGAIILMKLYAGSKELFSIIKYDREQVLAFNLVGNSQAVLEEIVNSFTKSQGALQKSALIELCGDGGKLVVIDRNVNYDITGFFKAFLNVRRLYTDEEMTEKVHEAIIHTALVHRNELPNEITSKLRSVSFQAIQNLEVFNQEEFFDKVFGAHSTPKLIKTYETFLKKNSIDGDSFKFVKNAIKPPKEIKYKTQEGVRISYGETGQKTVEINHGVGNKPTIITIKTQHLTEE
jgi:hypothetical protein